MPRRFFPWLLTCLMATGCAEMSGILIPQAPLVPEGTDRAALTATIAKNGEQVGPIQPEPPEPDPVVTGFLMAAEVVGAGCAVVGYIALEAAYAIAKSGHVP
jgi:hypothetical protein